MRGRVLSRGDTNTNSVGVCWRKLRSFQPIGDEKSFVSTALRSQGAYFREEQNVTGGRTVTYNRVRSLLPGNKVPKLAS
jgi:hypothetical protein